MMPNMPETVAGMLAAASLGAVWSSCSPDFGEQGVLDRFGQIEPVVFIAPDGYWYNGKQNDVTAKVAGGAGQAADRPPGAHRRLSRHGQAGGHRHAERRGARRCAGALRSQGRHLRAAALRHPLYILFSSGTTGIPKCIVHSAGGTLLQHLKEQRLHGGLRDGDRLFYFTTCGWMMWNWLVSGLASGATLLLYDGSPFHPDGNVLFDFADAEKMTYFGTSAKFIDTLRKSGLRPIDSHDLSTVRTISSTGSPLSPEGFAFVYDGIKKDVHLASISGGTDIVSCFVLGVPTEPVWSGEIQGPGLGMAVDVWDDDGKPVRQEKGELVCTQAVPVDAGRLLERSRRQEIPRRLFRALRQCLVPWRLRRMDRAWRHDHPWPLRRDAQPGRRAHRHRRDLQPGRADAGDRRGALHRPGFRRRRARRAVRPPRRRACRSTPIWKSASARRSAPAAARATCRRRSSPSPTSRAPSPARSPNLPCATSSMAATVKNKEALANPQALELFRDLEALRN